MIECTLEYYENLTRASRSNTGTSLTKMTINELMSCVLHEKDQDTKSNASATLSNAILRDRTIVKHIENALGFDGNDDASKLYTRRHQPFKLTNPHGTSVDTPWGKVSAIERSESTQVYVERMLRGCVGNNML